MNIIKEIVKRLEDARGSNKGYPCKTFATELAAEKATADMAQKVANYFIPEHRRSGDARSARFILIQMPEWDNRWVGVIDQTEVMGRPDATGGYLGIAKGFFVY